MLQLIRKLTNKNQTSYTLEGTYAVLENVENIKYLCVIITNDFSKFLMIFHHNTFKWPSERQCISLCEKKADVPIVNSTRYGLWSFRSDAPRIWNMLPNNLRVTE